MSRFEDATETWVVCDALTLQPVAKHIRLNSEDGKKNFIWTGLNGESGLPEGVQLKGLALYAIERADATKPVVLVEGEKCADYLLNIGICAVGTVCGAASIPGDDALRSLLEFPEVFLWADNDDTGNAHMDGIASELRRLGLPSVKKVEWDDAPNKGDCADAVEAGVDVQSLIEQAHKYPLGVTHRDEEDEQEFPIVRFHSGLELAIESTEPPEFVCEPWIVEGSITEVSGKIKRVGKTTFITRLCATVIKGERFLGKPTMPRPVIYMTEQPKSSFKEALRRAGLLGQKNIQVVFWGETISFDWDYLISIVTRKALESNALIVVDTLPQFASIRGDGENTTGEALNAMKPLQDAASKGLGVIVVRHERKSGGDVGDSARGSSAFGGAVDTLVSINRGGGNTDPNVRVLSAISRFDGVPEELYVELTEDGYIPLGSSGAVAESRATQLILDNTTEFEGDAMTLDEFVLNVEGLKKTTASKVLRQLVEEGKLKCNGTGTKGSPFLYSRT